MIIYVTTITLSWTEVQRYAELCAREIGTGSCELLLEKPHLTPREQAAWGQEVWDLHEAKSAGLLNAESLGPRIIVASTYELPLLRLLRRVREKNEPLEQLVLREPVVDLEACVVWRNKASRVEGQRMRVDYSGEFLDVWPNGFFEERVPELF